MGGLADQLQQRDGYPWGVICNLSNPALIEQLYDLAEMLEIKGRLENDERGEKVFLFALQLADDASPTNSKIIGELISLINANPEAVFRTMNTKDLNEGTDWIHKHFEDLMQGINARLLDLKMRHAATKIQDEHIAVHNRLPLELARMLISQTGKVNVGIIESLLEAFLTKKKQPINYEINLGYALRLLQVTPELREKLSRIRRPSHPKANANMVIRSALGLPEDAPITRVDAITTALSGILSHLRQGSDGSCFATPIAIELLSCHLDKCLDDFGTLLEVSKLTRDVDGVTTDFPFLLGMSNKNLDKKITLNEKGYLLTPRGEAVPIWEAPGLAAACQAIGIESPKAGIQAAAKRLCPSRGTISTTPSDILKDLIDERVPKGHSVKEAFDLYYAKASFAFGAQESNPLQQIWENAIAGMAEGEENGMIRAAIITAVMNTLLEKIEDLFPPQSLPRELIVSALRPELIKTIHLQYDPIVPVGRRSQDQHSTEGAFVLYDGTDDPRRNRWLRVDTPESFQNFIALIVRRTRGQLKQNPGGVDSEAQKSVSRALKRLAEYVMTPQFISESVSKYHHVNREALSSEESYDELQYTPWMTKCGNNFSKVVQVYKEEIIADSSKLFMPLSTQDLLMRIIELGRTCSDEEKKAYKDNPHRLIPTRIVGVHAFSLMLGHPTLSRVWQKECDTEAWISRHVIMPGRSVAEGAVSPAMQSGLIKTLGKDFSDEKISQAFTSNALSIPEGLSARALRARLLELLEKYPPPKEVPPAELSAHLDTRLYQHLPVERKTELEHSALHFADSNWSDGIYDVHFCFVVNPGNGELELWGSRGNGKHMFALDQNRWLKGHKWEIFPDLSERKS